MRAWLLFATILILCTPHSSRAILIHPDRDEADYRQLAERYPAVCSLQAGQATGSGTLIAPSWVLTAAHCVDADALAGNDLRIHFGDQVYRPRKIHLHPDYRPGWIYDDLALIHLDRPVEGVQPIPLYTGQDELSRDCTLVGFGWSGPIRKGESAIDEKDTEFALAKRAGTTRIASEEEEFLHTRIDITPSGTQLPGAAVAGDSGGPALFDIDGRPYLAGIIVGHQAGTSNDILARKDSADDLMRVSAYAPWIQGKIAPTSYPRWPWLALLATITAAACFYLTRRKRHEGATNPPASPES